METDRVYIITRGTYSDYEICAVTLDRKRAETLKKLFGHDAEIEEYIPEECKLNGRVYTVYFENGTITKIEMEVDGIYQESLLPYTEEWPRETIVIHCKAKDKNHAVKIAQDEYAMWKAQKEGII